MRNPSRCSYAVLRPAILILALAAAVAPALGDTTYRTPPAPLADIVDAPRTPGVDMSPDLARALLIEYPSLIPVAELAERELRLGGLRIKPTTNGPSRIRYATKLTFKSMSDLSERVIHGLPDGAGIAWPTWSPDSMHVAFVVKDRDGLELWFADVLTGKARALTGDLRVNAAAGMPFIWLPDSRSLVCAIVPEARGAEPSVPAAPTGPVVQENIGKTAPARTYQDLLENPHDEALFAHYLSGQLMRVGIDGSSRTVGQAGLVWDFDASPDGKWLLVETLERPFSYLVPARRFPRRVEILNLRDGAVRVLAKLPLQEEVPIAFGSVPTGPRGHGWRADAPATVYWTEARDGGDARVEAEVRDEVLVLDAPFDGEPRSLVKLGLRHNRIQWGTDDLALVAEWWWKTRKVRTWIVRPGTPGSEPKLLWDRSWEDRYGDPGDPVLRPTKAGTYVLYTTPDGGGLYLEGRGASPEGDRPFFDRLDLASGETTRLFRSEAPFYERALYPMDPHARRLLVRRESVEDPPEFYVRDLDKGKLRQLTSFPHPSPQLKGLGKEMIRYKRSDGIDLTATLYLPPGHEPSQGRLPVLIWAYPQEFKSADAAGQVTNSPYRFDRVGWWSPLLFLTQGYAVLDDPTMPIIGEGDEEPNDTYVEQLVSSAGAAIDEIVRRGIADRDRIAVGGHSYGAFMTANLLAHSDLFRAGIARSGAYNRTLTPFGFQSEERTLWEGPDVYFNMSPFMHADSVDEPLLLIHGDADNNSGTFPMQSERFYNALKGHGATARLVMLPHESHGYRARESIHHMLWETTLWLDTWVKNAPPRNEMAAAPTAAPAEATR